MVGRRAEPTLTFNGYNVTDQLKAYLSSVKMIDVAAGSSDSISIDMYNAGKIWLTDWYPTKGDEIKGGLIFHDWLKDGEDERLNLGTFILDSIKFSGGPLSCSFGGLAIPQDQSFKTRQRTKTWENVTLEEIGIEISQRYGLECLYDARYITIDSLEQTDKTDSDFLYSTVKEYGLKMKVYNRRIVIFDMGNLEALDPVTTIRRSDWIDDGWDYEDALEGTYTGAIVKYKGDGSDEIRVTVGNADEDSPKARVLYVNKKCDSEADAVDKGKAEVNTANESATKLSGSIWGKPEIVSGVTVTVEDLGKANGKYLVDKVTTEVSDSGTKQTVEMHKCYKRL